MSVERIVPADLDGHELWRRNSEYVSADAYDAAVKRIAELEAALERFVDCLSYEKSGDQYVCRLDRSKTTVADFHRAETLLKLKP